MKGAHLAGRHVEQMARVARRIGGPPAELTVPFDQMHAGRRRTSAQQMQRQQRAAETGADDRNVGHRRFSLLGFKEPRVR